MSNHEIEIHAQRNARGPFAPVPGAVYRQGFFYSQNDDFLNAANRIIESLRSEFPEDRFTLVFVQR